MNAARLPATRVAPRGRWLSGAAILVVGLALVGGLAVLLPGLSLEAKNRINLFLYPEASLGCALLLLVAARTQRGRERWAWLAFGSGLACWGIGEVVSELYWGAGLKVPYPGWPDVFFLAGYPLMGLGVLLLPRLRLGRFERARALLDATLGALALSLLAWITYLERATAFDPDASLLENWINALYPIGDVLLLLAVMTLAFRRSERRFDLELLAVGTGLVLNAVADVVYFVLTASETYVDGMWLDGMWPLGYGAFGLAAWAMIRPPARAASEPDRRLGRLMLPYGLALALVVTVLVNGGAGQRFITIVWVVLTSLVVARQWVATREVREVSEGQRNLILRLVSHELRTPLTAVHGYAQLLAHDWSQFGEPERREMLEEVADQASRLGGTLADIANAAKGGQPPVLLHRGVWAVRRVLEMAVRSLPPRAQAQVTVDAESGLEVDGDPDRLHQVLVNLLTNAVRYGNGRILLRASRQGQAVVFEVHDDGPGIPKKYEEAIWQRFERGAHRLDSAIPGTGIGLPIARALVEAHGGSLRQHRSELQGGACFRFTIPQSPGSDPRAADNLALPSTVRA